MRACMYVCMYHEVLGQPSGVVASVFVCRSSFVGAKYILLLSFVLFILSLVFVVCFLCWLFVYTHQKPWRFSTPFVAVFVSSRCPVYHRLLLHTYVGRLLRRRLTLMSAGCRYRSSAFLDDTLSSLPLPPLPPPPSQAYKVADHLRTCPPVERVSLPLCSQERLTPLQIAHFAACLR